VLKRGTLLVTHKSSHGARELELDQLLIGAHFNELAFAIGQPAANTVRAAGQVSVLRLPGDALRELTRTSAALKEAMWKGVGKKAALSHLTQSEATLAKWQVERIVRRLESHLVGDEVLEVQFTKSAVVMLVSGSATLVTAGNAMLDFAKMPAHRWDFQAATQIKAPAGTNLFVTYVFAPGSRFMAEEESIQHRETRRRLHDVNTESRTLQMLRSGNKSGGLASLLASVSNDKTPGSKMRSVIQLQLAASKTLSLQKQQRKVRDSGNSLVDSGAGAAPGFAGGLFSFLCGGGAPLGQAPSAGQRRSLTNSRSTLNGQSLRTSGLDAGGSSSARRQRSQKAVGERAAIAPADSQLTRPSRLTTSGSVSTRLTARLTEAHTQRVTRRSLTVKGLHQLSAPLEGLVGGDHAGPDEPVSERALHELTKAHAVPSLGMIDAKSRKRLLEQKQASRTAAAKAKQQKERLLQPLEA